MNIIDILVIKIIRFWTCVFYGRNPELKSYIIPSKKILIDVRLSKNESDNKKKGTFVKYYSPNRSSNSMDAKEIKL